MVDGYKYILNKMHTPFKNNLVRKQEPIIIAILNE
jgi:hypothetical protein